MSKKVIVTGGAGFIGSNFVRMALEKQPDWSMTVVDSLTYSGDLGRLEDIKDKITLVEADICDGDEMDDVTQDTDLIVHFAAESHVDRSIADASPFVRTNVLGTIQLLESALKNKVGHFHHVSTDEVYGTLELGSDARFSEETAYDPRSPYSAAKASSDHFVKAYGETYGLNYTMTNCSNNYGPWDSPGRAIPIFVTNLIQGKPIGLYGSGEAVRDYLHVDDHCDAILTVIEKAEPGSYYCIGGHDGEMNGTKLATMIVEAMGKDESMITYVKDRPGHDMRYAIDASKIHKELGWQPQIPMAEGLKQTIDWYSDHTDWWQPYLERISLMRD